MGKLLVDDLWIVGEPAKGVQLASSVVQWVRENSGVEYTPEFSNDMDRLLEEVRTKYEHGAEGYYAFATQIIDSVLARAYPYLAKWAASNGKRVRATRKTELIDGVQRFVIYSLVVTDADQPEEGPPTGTEGNIDDNPFPLDPVIDPSLVPADPDSPYDSQPPPFQGLPYDPLNPLRREPSPYVPRGDQSDIPYQPGGWFDPESPIQDGEPGSNESRQPRIDSLLPRANEFDIPLANNSDSNNPPDNENPPTDGEPPTDENPPPEKPADTSRIESILLAILQEIIRQGSLTRDSIGDAVGALTNEIRGSTITLEQAIEASTNLLADSLDIQTDAVQSTLSEMKGILEKTYAEIQNTETEADSILSDALELASEFIGDTIDSATGIISVILDGIISEISFLGSIIGSGLDILTEGVISGDRKSVV